MSKKSYQKLNNILVSLMCFFALFFAPLTDMFSITSEAATATEAVVDYKWTDLFGEKNGGSTLTSGHYYISSDTTYDASSLSAGTSGLIVTGVVYIYIPKNVTLTCIGAAGSNTTPGGAGIEVSGGNTVYFYGKGNVVARGGKAGNGGDGGDGASAYVSGTRMYTGVFGSGGSGGGGGGAGIGTKGAIGPAINTTTSQVYYMNLNGKGYGTSVTGVANQAGSAAVAASSAGTIYKDTGVTISATGGAAGAGGSGGGTGKAYSNYGYSDTTNYNFCGAGGGGGGGGGGYAGASIGSGGYSGASGGTGGIGNIHTSTTVFLCKNGEGGSGGYGGNNGSNGTKQTSTVLNVGYVDYGNTAISGYYVADASSIYPNDAGGASGSAGEKGTEKDSIISSYTTQFSVTFQDTDKETTLQTTSYQFTSTTITVPTYAPSARYLEFQGWQVTTYGISVATNDAPLTTAETTIYQAGDTITITGDTYGDIVLQPLLVSDYGITYDPLNNLQNAEGSTIKNVSGDSATTSLRVFLMNSKDSLTLYKISDCNWDSEKNEYKDPAWNLTVSDWLAATSGDDPDYSGTTYSTPVELGEASTDLWKTFYKDLLEGDNAVTSKLTAIQTDALVTNSGDSSITFDNLSFGSYAILGKSVTNNKYVVVVVNLVPERTTSDGGYTIDTCVNVSLKYKEPSLEKKIDEKDAEVVTVGQTVNFTVTFDMPEIYGTRATYKLSENEAVYPYQLYFTDNMSTAFEFVDTNAITVTYTCTDNSETDNSFPTSTISYVEKDSNGAEHPGSGTIYTITTTSGNGNADSTIRLDFNVNALKEWLAMDDTPSGITNVTIAYQATVTSQIKTSSEDNYNTADLWYEYTETGSAVKNIEDTVRVYTYGINVVKLDGTNEKNTPLSGAEFALYKEITGSEITKSISEYQSDENYYVYDDNGNSRIFKLFSNAYNATLNVASAGKFTSVATTEGITLKGLTGGAYVLEEIKAPTGYSDLEEDIYFEIKEPTEAQAQQLYAGSMAGMYEMDDTYVASGITKFTVYNFKGLTLPSTGGMGTLLFTILGASLMLLAIIVALLKRRDSSYYM